MRKRFSILRVAIPSGLLGVALYAQAVPAEPSASSPTAEQLDAQFQSVVRPFLDANCFECHGDDVQKAGLKLNAYTNLDSVVKDFRRWNTVLGKLKRGEMPPDNADTHPTAAQLKPVIDWIEAMQAVESKNNAGDPGLVFARRLSNSEYDYTIRDLTGVDIQPAKEFPVDPANEAGFDNSGESLTMSPELVKKYLDAAQSVADHIVFKPDGFTFALNPMVSDEDRDNYAVHRVVDYYKQIGLTISKPEGNYVAESLDYADYFLAAWRYQHRTALGKRFATLTDFARESNLSPKYLNTIWGVLNEPGEKAGPIAAVQARWFGLSAPVRGKEPDDVRVGCGYIRDLILGLRPLVKPEFTNLVPNSNKLAEGSQTIVLWKDRQYANNRMTYAGNALQLDMSGYAKTDPALLIPDGVLPQARYENSFKQFCAVFPDAFVVWERARMFLTAQKDIDSDLSGHRLLTAGFHSQMGYFRDDAPLYNLVLDDTQKQKLDQLWTELSFITEQPIRQFKQFLWFERAEPPSLMTAAEFNEFKPEDDTITSTPVINKLANVYVTKVKGFKLGDTVNQQVQDYFVSMDANIRNLEQAQKAAELSHLQSLLDFTARAFRRPLTSPEKNDLLDFYDTLRAQNISHEDAIRYSVASVLMSPSFCFRVNSPGNQAPGKSALPLTDYELASRLSYFLWSSMPDAELLAHAAAGDLHQPKVLAAEAQRMMQDERIRGLATEFGGNWLDIRRFEEDNAVDRGHFTTFTDDLRSAMFQEPIHFFVDVVRRDSSVLDFLYGDYTFVNPVLAKHYGMPIPAVVGPNDWVRVDDAQKYQRGGLLPMAAFLTKNAPGLRTSPVKRGFWVVSKLLGEYIPAPPPNVPTLPSDESKLGNLTLRQTLAQHHADPNCASCHEKFDSFGLVFEGYGPIGELRTLDLGNRPVETNATFPDGSEETGLTGLRTYLHAKVQDEFVDNLTRKLLVYALGRSLLPSDEPLIADLHQKLSATGYRFDTLIGSIITSPQFLMKRNTPASSGTSNLASLSP